MTLPIHANMVLGKSPDLLSRLWQKYHVNIGSGKKTTNFKS